MSPGIQSWRQECHMGHAHPARRSVASGSSAPVQGTCLALPGIEGAPKGGPQRRPTGPSRSGQAPQRRSLGDIDRAARDRLFRLFPCHSGIFWKLSGTEALANKPEKQGVSYIGRVGFGNFSKTISAISSVRALVEVHCAQRSLQLLHTLNHESVMDELSGVLASATL